jgi:hypothetical protein
VSASQTLTGLAKTGINWDKISPTMKAALWEQLFRVCQSTNERGVANAIWAMGTIGAPVSAQPEVVRDAMLSAASSVMTGCSAWALCNIVWGLAKMQLDWNMFPRCVYEFMCICVKHLNIYADTYICTCICMYKCLRCHKIGIFFRGVFMN